MTKTLNVRNLEGYDVLRRQDLWRASGHPESLASGSEQLHPAPTSPAKYDVGAISWGQTNW